MRLFAVIDRLYEIENFLKIIKQEIMEIKRRIESIEKKLNEKEQENE